MATLIDKARGLASKAKDFLDSDPNTQGFQFGVPASLSKLPQKISNSVKQYPTPASYFAPKIGNAVANAIQGPVSPIPSKLPAQIIRNTAGQTVRDVSNRIPDIGTSMLRASPPGQLYEYAKPLIQNKDIETYQPQLQRQQRGDLYNSLQGIGLTTQLPAAIAGGAINVGMQGIQNKFNNKPFLNNADVNFSKGLLDSAPLGPISTLNPIGRTALRGKYVGLNYQAMIPTRAAVKGIQQAVEGALLGAIEPGETKDRLSKIKDYALFGAITGALTQAGGDMSTLTLSKLSTAFGKPIKTIETYLKTANLEIPTNKIDPATGKNIKKPAWQVFGSTIDVGNATKSAKMPQSSTLLGKAQQITSEGSLLPEAQQKLISGQSVDQIARKNESQVGQTLDAIIEEGRKQIKSGQPVTDKRSIRQAVDEFYTQWVDRFHPIVKASQQAKKTLQDKGANLRPEYDPEYLVRRLTGAGGIADTRFQQELKPVIDQLDKLKIDKLDFDTYLANKRIAGFGEVGRDIYGADPAKAKEIVGALESKYGQNISGLAQKLYDYQNKGFQELVDAGFISKEAAQTIQSQNPDYAPLNRAMDEISNYLGLPTNKTMQGTQVVKQIKGSKRQIESPLESIIGNTFSQRAAIEKNRVAKSIVGLTQIDPNIGFKKAAQSGSDTITVWNNGQKEYWSVGKDIADVAKGLNEESMNMVLKVLQAPASLLRQGATGRNPEFMIPNIIRDQLDAGISSKYGYIPFVDYLSGLKSMITNDAVYQKWQQSGAKIDLGEISGKKSISQMFIDKTKKKNIVDWLRSGLDFAGKYSEQPTRVGLFKKAYSKTGNELISAMESRDATLDFARMGSKMKVANSIIPFLNVGVQGFDKFIRSVKNNPGKVAFGMAVYGVAPQLATQIYNLQNHPQEYAEIPQYIKDSNFVIVVGRNEKGTVNYITIPKGNITPLASNPVQSFVDYLYQVDGQSFGQMATSLLSDSLPVLAGGSSPKEVALKTIGSNIPQAVKPIAENLLNKSFYKYDAKKEQSKEIVPYYLQNKQPYEQAYSFTPEMYKKIGAVLNTSPLMVQNLMEGYLAGYTKIPAQIIDSVTKISRGEQVDTNDRTILRRFFQETYPTGSSTPKPTTPQAPPVMERLFGKAKAAEEASKATTSIGQLIQKESKDSKMVSDYKDILTGKKKVKDVEAYLKETYGVTSKEVERRVIKNLDVTNRSPAVYEILKDAKTTANDLNGLVDDAILTDAVAKEMYSQGIITEQQQDTLRKYIAIRKNPKKNTTGKKGRKRKQPSFTPPTPKLQTVRQPRYKKLTLRDLYNTKPRRAMV